MVSIQDVEPQIEAEVEDGFINPSEAEVEPDAELEEQEPDPLAEIRQRLEGTVTRVDFDRLAQQFSSERGRAQKLEKVIEGLQGANPLADVDPRLEANEALLTTLADALISSALTEDSSRIALQQARAALDQARGQRARQRERAELLDEVRRSLPQQEPPAAQGQNPALIAATERVAGYAEARGLSPSDIPASAWSLLDGETLEQAVTRVKGVVDSLVAETQATTRVAQRRTAAGPGTPTRSGGPSYTNLDDLEEAFLNEELGDTPEKNLAEYKRLGAALGARL